MKRRKKKNKENYRTIIGNYRIFKAFLRFFDNYWLIIGFNWLLNTLGIIIHIIFGQLISLSANEWPFWSILWILLLTNRFPPLHPYWWSRRPYWLSRTFPYSRVLLVMFWSRREEDEEEEEEEEEEEGKRRRGRRRKRRSSKTTI